MPQPVLSIPLGHAVAGGQYNLTVAGSVVTLTVPAGVSCALIQVLTNPISLTEDDSTPSTANGFLLNAGDAWISYEPARVRMIRQTGSSAAVQVGYYN